MAPSSLVAGGLTALLALTLALTGCSGTAAPAGRTGAQPLTAGTSPAQLCGALTDFRADLASADPADPAAYVAQLKAAATRLVAVGLPDAMPTGARSGFAVQVDLIRSLPDAATAADLAAVGRAETDPALEVYLATTCPS